MGNNIRKAFTLVELMIVLAIIAVIAAIAIPNLFEARKAANQAAAIGTLKTIVTSQGLFREVDKDGNGKLDYGTLPQFFATDLVDEILASGTKTGYLFETGPGGNTGFELTHFWAFANPRVLDATGNRSFATNQQMMIFYTQQVTITGGDLTALQSGGTIPTGMLGLR